MIIRKLDINSDWEFGKGLSNYLFGEMALEENIKTRLLSWKNDCFFALDDGIDYRNFLDKGQENNLALAIKSILLTSEGVMGVKQISLELSSNRELTVSYTIDTIYGSNFQNTVSP